MTYRERVCTTVRGGRAAPPSMAPNIIKVCGRNLEEVRVLGVGGQGSVSLCKDRASGKHFAMKTASAAYRVLAHEFNTVRYLLDSGVREGIALVHDIDTVESGSRVGKSVILLDFCNGGDLLSELKRHPGCRLSDRQAAAVVRSVAQTLSRCHEAGIMHRDIKLENILLCRSGRGNSAGTKRRKNDSDPWLRGLSFVLSDFGLARKFRKGDSIRDGCVAGTYQYVAPEMIEEEEYDERVDVWSLGMVLHVLLTGDFPSHIHMARNQLEVPFDSDALLVCTVEMCPDELDLGAPMYSHLTEGARSLLAGMLRKKPHHRFTLSEVRAHSWLKLEVAQSQVSNSCLPEHAALAGIKRIRFTMPWGPDIVRELRPVQVDTATAISIHPDPLVGPEEVQFMQFNPHAVQAAY